MTLEWGVIKEESTSIGGGGGSVVSFQEKFTVGDSSVFEFTKGTYTMGINAINWYLDGIKQANSALFEIDNSTIEIIGALPQGATVVFDYLQYSNTAAGVPGPKGDTFTFDDLTPEQVELLRGPQGIKGEGVDNLNASHIENALGYMPANIEVVTELDDNDGRPDGSIVFLLE